MPYSDHRLDFPTVDQCIQPIERAKGRAWAAMASGFIALTLTHSHNEALRTASKIAGAGAGMVACYHGGVAAWLSWQNPESQPGKTENLALSRIIDSAADLP